VDAAVSERRRESVVDQAVLVDEREAAEARACDGDVEVIAAAGTVDDHELLSVGKGLSKQLFEPPAHRPTLAAARLVSLKRLAIVFLLVLATVVPASATAVIDGDRTKRYATRIAAHGERVAGSQNEYEVATMVRRSLANLGYAIEWQRVRLPNGDYSRNVIGRTPGPTRVVVVAHMDGVHNTVAANDNGSGTAGMIELARQFQGVPGLLVAALGAEERHTTGSPYHLGSLRLVRSLSATERDRIQLMVSLDMIGVGTTLNVRGIEASPNRSARKLLRTAARIGIQASYFQDSGVSDHAEFTRAGVPGTLLTWRWDSCWHLPCDRPSRLSAWKLKRAVRLTMVAARDVLT
jgi:Peptidase family M28